MKSKSNSIVEKDVILVYVENHPAFFARVENIAPDSKRNWWRVKLLIFQIPLMTTTWILDNEQLAGADFTMAGTPIRIEKVIAPSTPPDLKTIDEEKLEAKETAQKPARILSLNSKMKEN